ncbi:MAG: hypothetical protein JXB05_03735 [Myxococcaceae bacterium]|nr:hypothetical protein [Myxococcaceae bacterium]
MQRSMSFLGASIAAVLVFAVVQSGCGTRSQPMKAKASPRPVVTPLYEQRLHEMQHIFDGKPAQDVAQAPMQPAEDGVQTAFLFPSGLISACAASGCAASACAASGCAGSGCAASACGGSGCGGSVCGGSACGGSACVGSACAGSGCAGSACGGSGCVGSSCGGSGCVGSVCGGSACAGSACSLSACVGSACTQSGCVGSACGQSGCIGSACKSCSSQGEDKGSGTMLAAYGTSNVVAASCPFGPQGDVASVRVAGFNLARTERGIELSWITTGSTAESFKVYRTTASGAQELLAEGKAASDRLMRVALPTPKNPAESDVYMIAITDQLGWETRVSSNGKTERQPLQLASSFAMMSPR